MLGSSEGRRPVIARLTVGRAYRHYLGFEAGELRRAQRDATFNNARRHGVYPLVGLDPYGRNGFHQRGHWSRLAEVSTFCPFQFSSRAGLAAALARYRREPAAGAHALYLEAVSLAFNERMGLLAQGRLIDAVRQAGLTEVIRRYQARIDAAVHGVYEVRRVAGPGPEPLRSSGGASAASITVAPRL